MEGPQHARLGSSWAPGLGRLGSRTDFCWGRGRRSWPASRRRAVLLGGETPSQGRRSVPRVGGHRWLRSPHREAAESLEALKESRAGWEAEWTGWQAELGGRRGGGLPALPGRRARLGSGDGKVGCTPLLCSASAYPSPSPPRHALPFPPAWPALPTESLSECLIQGTPSPSQAMLHVPAVDPITAQPRGRSPPLLSPQPRAH